MSNFIQNCLNGHALLDEIHDYIHEWHDSDSTQTIFEYLGMTKKEYLFWMADPDLLPYIVKAHKAQLDYDNVKNLEFTEAHAIAARAASTLQGRLLMDWLRETGLWKE